MTKIYYFEGDEINGLDYLDTLIEISKFRQGFKFIGYDCKCALKKGKIHKENVFAIAKQLGMKYVNPLDGAIEGCMANRIYYIHGFKVKYCNIKSLKGVLIKIFGKNLR